MHLIVIRPQPGCQATVSAALARSIQAYGCPLFTIRPVAWDLPDSENFDAVLIGSANAIRQGGDGLAALAGRPAYAVGEATAQACRDAGLEVIATGTGGLQAVLAKLDPTHRRLLRLAGEARVALDPPTGITIIERIVYVSEPRPMPGELCELIRAPSVIALHSAEAARHFRRECERNRVDISRLTLATIGPRVAEAAGAGWQQVQCAANPSEPALLALAHEMCKESD